MDGRLGAQGLRPKAQEAQEALRDSQLDREIESAVGIEPSPEFLARVRTRIAADPALAVESGFSRIRRLSLEPLWGVAIVGVLLAVVAPQFMREEMKRASADRVARGVVEAPVVEAPVETDFQVGPPVTVDAVSRRVAPEAQIDEPHTLPLQLSPVQFAEEDRLAFAWFVTAVADGTVSEEVAQALGEEEMTPLGIASLVIDPLPPLARVEKQGESQW